jgi:hypothetical protein
MLQYRRTWGMERRVERNTTCSTAGTNTRPRASDRMTMRFPDRPQAPSSSHGSRTFCSE